MYVLSPDCGVSPALEAAAPLPAHYFGALRRPSAGPSNWPALLPPSPQAEIALLSYPPGPPRLAAPPCQSQTTAEDRRSAWYYYVECQNKGAKMFMTF